MFKSGKDSMREFPTPERVFALCRYVSRNPCNREELYQEICLSSVFGDGNKEIFRYTVAVAQELEFIKEIEGRYSVTDAVQELENNITFRRYSAKITLSRTDSIYYKTTSLYIKLAENVMKCPNWGAVATLFNQNGMELSENNLLGWRFWTSFLGIGYLHQQMLIPNCYIRFKDVLEIQESFRLSEYIPIDEFMLWLEIQCPEIKESRDGNKIGLAVSNGLRTLDAEKIIELRSEPDAYKWKMYNFESEIINDLSHVRILR